MKLEVSLDRDWLNEYGDTIGEMIQVEIERAVKAEVNRVVREVVKADVDKLRERIAKMMREIPSNKVDAYLTRISREGLD